MLKSELPVTRPEMNGNYIVFDVASRKQWIAKVFTNGDGVRQVLSGQDHCIWDLTALDTPSFRWVLIQPLTGADMNRHLMLVV